MLAGAVASCAALPSLHWACPTVGELPILNASLAGSSMAATRASLDPRPSNPS